MEFSNKLFLPFIFVLIQLLTVFSAPLSKLESQYDEKWPAHFIKPSTWGNKAYAYIYNDKYELESWPGIELQHVHYNQEPNFYTFEVPLEFFHYDTHIIFSDGENQVPAKMAEGFEFYEIDAVYTTEGFVGVLRQLEGEKPNEVVRYEKFVCVRYFAKFENPKNYGRNLYLHYKIGGREWTEIPGERFEVTYDIVRSMVYSKCVHIYENEKEFSFAITDGEGHWDNNNGENYNYKTIDIPEEIIIHSDVTF